MFSSQTLFRVSKWLHKYVGLSFLLVFLFVASTGILLNHPALLSGWSVPATWLGKSYQYENWNRFAMRDALVFDSGAMLVGGKMGVWYSPRPGAAFQEMNEGLPEDYYLQDINCLLAVAHDAELRFYAGGRNGLYYRDRRDARWQPVPELSGTPIVDLVETGDQLMAFSPYGCFTSTISVKEPLFQTAPLQMESSTVRVPSFRLFFELHSGKLFGAPGRLVVDGIALILIFLSLSALYIWYVPWRRKQKKKRRNNTSSRLFAKLYREHLRIGIWGALFLFIVAISGALIRPPLIVLPSMFTLPYDAFFVKTPEILRATHTDGNRLVVATRDGWFSGKADLSSPLTELIPPLPVFGMGTTVLDTLGGEKILVGSFSGLYTWDMAENVAFDLSGKEAPAKAELRPTELMAAAAIVADGVLTGYVDYKKGLKITDDNLLLDRGVPEKISTRISLYHFLFELHNGRFLRDFAGAWYILFVPFVGLALMLVVITGTFDWLKRKKIVPVVVRKK